MFDITSTGVRNNSLKNRIPFVDASGQSVTDAGSWERSRNQQRNWETLNQIISLRTLPVEITEPNKQGNQWVFTFVVENPGTVEKDQDPVGAINADCDQVPMITGLGENPGCGNVLRVGHNIWFELT